MIGNNPPNAPTLKITKILKIDVKSLNNLCFLWTVRYDNGTVPVPII